MFLRSTTRYKDRKHRRYYSIVESRRVRDNRIVQKTVLYLGEINSIQERGWIKAIEVTEGRDNRQMSLFADNNQVPEGIENIIKRLMNGLELRRPRQWGACFIANELWEMLGLREFFKERLGDSRKGTRWRNVLQILVTYRLIGPGSEWRLHRSWYEQSAIGDILGEDFGIAEKDTLYRYHNRLLEHKEELFKHLDKRWKDLFNPHFEVLLYDLTSTYFESNPPFSDKRQFGYSRDKRGDCVQVVIALIVTPEGFPLAYEVLPGNTQDKQTLKGMLRHTYAYR